MLKRLLYIPCAILTMLTLLSACNLETLEDTFNLKEDFNLKKIFSNDNEVGSKKSIPAQTDEEMEFPEVQLRKGDSGQDVEALQMNLIKIGYDVKQTKVFDEETTWAITDVQLQQEKIEPTGLYDQETRESLEEVKNGNQSINPGEELAKPENKEKDGVKIVDNPHDIFAVVNKESALPDDYIPHHLVTPDIPFPFTKDLPKKQLRQVAAIAIEEMFSAAEEDGIELYGQSGYRSYDRQDVIYASNVEAHGEKEANNFSAKPGESEHQSGLTMDVTSAAMKFDLTTDFAKTEEGKWIEKHSSEYGFIIRYLKGKEEITGYQFEPWHLRYVGKEAAQEIMENDLTLEEYLDEKIH